MSLFRSFVVLSILWCLLIGGYGWMHPPVIPLDLSPQDASTAAAYTAAMWKSRLLWGVVAITPLFVTFLIALFVKRSKA